MNAVENHLQECAKEHRIEEAAGIYKMKTNIVEELFGRTSKKYVNELRKLAYFYHTNEYYNEAIETLQLVKDSMQGTE